MLELKKMDDNGLKTFLENGEPSTLEFLGANISEGFDNSLPGIALDKMQQNFADQAYADPKREATRKKFTKAEWAESEYKRDGVVFEDGWSEDRARFLAEGYDERKEREAILKNGNPDGMLSKKGAIGFVGQMIGGLPDPVNFIPFGAGVKGAGLAARLGAAVVEGAAGNLAVSAITRPYYEDRGIDSTWQDYVSDVFVGGALGGAFGGAGYALDMAKARRLDLTLKDKQAIAQASDQAINSALEGNPLDLTNFNEQISKLHNISDKERAELIQLKREEILSSTSVNPEEANAAASLHVANSVVMAKHLGISPEEYLKSNYGATFQNAEMVDGKIIKSSESSVKMNQLLDSELQVMAQEIDFAQKGEKIFEEGSFAGSQESTFPDWYREAGVKNKEHLFKVLESKKGPVYERLQAIAEERLLNGYETPTSRAAPSNEYRELIGQEAAEIPVGPDGEPLFQFAGPKAKGAPLDKLNEARLLEVDGKEMESIRQETGWFKAPDGKWRFEIDDSGAKFKPININKKKKFKLSEVLEHGQLFEAYPQLKDVNIEFAAHRGNKGGHFNSEKNTIKIMITQESFREGFTKKSYERLQEIMKSPEVAEYKRVAFSEYGPERSKAIENFKQSPLGQEYIGLTMMNLSGEKRYPLDLNTQAEAMNIILHEVQHSIQSVEGFARGGNKKADGGFNNYRNLHGEIEARDAEARRLYSPKESKANAPAVLRTGNENAIIKWRGEEVAQDLPPLKDKESIEFKNDPNGQMRFFKKAGGKERGAIQFYNDKKAVISLLKGSNESTIIHESAHLFLKNYQRLEADGKAPQAIKDDLNTLRAWAKKQPNEKGLDADTQLQEKVARAFEQYTREGKAPVSELQGVFDRMRQWLTAIYKNADELKVEISPEVRKVFDKMLALEAKPDLGPVKAMELPTLRTTEELDLSASSLKDETILNHRMVSEDEKLEYSEAMASLTKEEEELQTLFQGAETKLDENGEPIDPAVEAFNKTLEEQEAARVRLIEIAVQKKELKRQAYLNLEAREKTYSQVKSLMDQGVDPEKAILSLLEGGSSLRGLQGSGNSLDARINAIGETTSAKTFAKLRELDPRIEKLFMDDEQFNENVILEMLTIGKNEPGISKDPIAAKAAQVFSEMMETIRERANLAGAQIGKLDGYIPRFHDLEKMLGAGNREKWVQYIKDNVDLERSFKGLVGQDLEDAIDITYQNMTSGEWLTKEAGQFDPVNPLPSRPRNVAKRMEAERTIHFKTPEAELNYLKEFGQGRNILGMMVKHLQNHSRKIGIMESLGTQPEANLASLYSTLRQDIRVNEPDLIKRAKEIEKLNFQSVKNRETAVGKAFMLAMGEGTSFANPRLKHFGSMIRLFNSLSKLGAATLSQFTDFAQIKNEARLVTGNNQAGAWLEVLKDYFKGVSPEVRTQVLDHIATLGDGMNYANFNRFDQDNVNNWVGRMSDKMFKYSGQNWHNNKGKSAMALIVTKSLGKSMDKSWDSLAPNLKAMLSQYGSFDEAKWNMLKEVKPLEIDGVKYFHPGMLNEIPVEKFKQFIPEGLEGKELEGALRREKYKLETDLQTFFLEEIRNGMLEPDARVRRLATFGLKAGTLEGEAARLMMQFKSFSIAYSDRVLGGKRFSDVNSSKWGESLKGDPSGAIQHVVASLGLAYMSMVAKDLSKGLEPKDPTLGKTWLMAGFQSGGLGIMGDFMQAGISSRSGTDALSTLAGPTWSTASSIINIGGRTIREPFSDNPNYKGLAEDYTSFAKGNVPFGSLWYTRAAVNYLVWDRLKESLEPGSIRRSERRLKKEYNQQSLRMSSFGF